MSIISLAYLLVFGIVGDVETLSADVSFSLTRESFDITIDPMFAVWVPEETIPKYHAFAFGNIIVIGSWSRNKMQGNYLIAHESMHIKQFRALGWLSYPAGIVLDIEPPKDIPVMWEDSLQPERTMWGPPKWWHNQWTYLSIAFAR